MTSKPIAEKTVTMADIARKAGVSKITVSRALADSPLVKADTREQIKGLAKDLGYRLNIAARNLRQQRTSTIAVIMEMMPSTTRPMSEAYPLGLLGGIIQELTVHGYNTMLSTVESFSRTAPAADGIILLGQGIYDNATEQFGELGLPLVIWGSSRADHEHVIVGSDNVSGGRLAARRLLESGKHNLVFLGDIEYTEIADRYDGFRQEIKEQGATLIARSDCPFTFADGHDTMIALLEQHGDAIDGVFACNDSIAMGAIRALHEHGLTVPDQVSVIGFDDTPSSAFFVPPITTIRQDWNEGGILLARKVMDLIDGKSAHSQELPVGLVVRKS